MGGLAKTLDQYAAENKELGYGPKMKALPNDRWRRFVQHMAITGGKSRLLCMTSAGFHGTDESLHVYACKLMQDPRIQEAIVEVTRGDMAMFLPNALRRLKQAVDDPQDTNGVKAAVEIMNRTGLHAVQEVRNTHELVGNTDRLARLKSLAKQTGLDLDKLLGERLSTTVTDAEFVDVTPAFDVSGLV